MKFDIDVSGMDILSSNYTICVASKNGDIIRGFKFSKSLINVLSSKFSRGLYNYKKSSRGIVIFKIRIYSIVIYYIFKSIGAHKVSLNICRDFYGLENVICDNINYFLKDLLGLNILECDFGKLGVDSFADKYAYLMRNDSKNKMKTYIKITLEEFEKFL